MTVRDFIKQEIDIDVYDDVTEGFGICFVGPLWLTDKGKRHFAEVPDLEIEMHEESGNAVVKIDDCEESVWQKRLDQVKELFYAAAGYCSKDDYIKWFTEQEAADEEIRV